MDDESYRSGLSQDTIVKIGELKRRAYKYPQYLPNPDGIIRLDWLYLIPLMVTTSF
jgi:hypothetical protein